MILRQIFDLNIVLSFLGYGDSLIRCRSPRKNFIKSGTDGHSTENGAETGSRTACLLLEDSGRRVPDLTLR